MGRLMKKERISGGGALTLASGLDGADFCDWGDDGNIYFGTNPGIMRVPVSGGKAEMVVAPDPKKNEIDFEGPQLLPGSKVLLYTVVTTKGFNDPSAGLHEAGPLGRGEPPFVTQPAHGLIGRAPHGIGRRCLFQAVEEELRTLGTVCRAEPLPQMVHLGFFGQ